MGKLFNRHSQATNKPGQARGIAPTKVKADVCMQLPCVEHFVLYYVPEGGSETKLPNVCYYEELMAAASEEFEWLKKIWNP